MLKDNALLFFATTLPYEDALKRCKEIRCLFCGGVFAGGAHVVYQQGDERQEYIYELNPVLLSLAETARKDFSFRILAYRRNHKLYKLTFVRPAKKPWSSQEAQSLAGIFKSSGVEKFRWFVENHCLQIVAEDAYKANGLRMICRWLGISLAEAAAAGDSEEDEEMVYITGNSSFSAQPF